MQELIQSGGSSGSIPKFRSVEPSTSATMVKPSGDVVHLKLSQIDVRVMEYWRSPKSGGRYPSHWRIKLPSFRLEIEITSLVRSQEIFKEGSTRIIYWEGAVAGKGISSGRSITCEGYVELTGYARVLDRLF